MNQNRREFLGGTAWLSLAAAAAGCMGTRMSRGGGGTMSHFRTKPMDRIRVGIVGLGDRGRPAVHRIALIPGCVVTALCDLDHGRVSDCQRWLHERGRPKAAEYVGPEAYKRLCDSDGVDVVYNVTPIDLHRPISCYAMKAGKHTLLEVCGCSTTEECWEFVETCEATRRHCMMLENCCYGEYELLQLNLVRQGLLGDIVHAEAGYIHDCREYKFKQASEHNAWRLRRALEHKGNQYPTHGLGPVALAMNINRGDRFDYLTAIESRPAALGEFAKAKFPADSWQNKLKYSAGDMSITNIRTVNGATITLQYDVVSPRPYSRINMLSGTKGISMSYPRFNVAFEKQVGDNGAHRYFDDAKAAEIREAYRHPLWKEAGKVAARLGGHGGMDFIMDLRWAYCLQNGLPLDMDVYDLAAWSSIFQLSEMSVNGRSKVIDVPDFTRGGWRTACAADIGGVDLKKMGLDETKIEKDSSQLNV